MNYIITLWLMTSPGLWDRTVLEFNTHDECHRAIEIFEEKHPPEKPWRLWYEYILEPSGNGIPDRVHRLKALGNSVVPQIPELIGRAIMETQ